MQLKYKLFIVVLVLGFKNFWYVSLLFRVLSKKSNTNLNQMVIRAVKVFVKLNHQTLEEWGELPLHLSRLCKKAWILFSERATEHTIQFQGWRHCWKTRTLHHIINFPGRLSMEENGLNVHFICGTLVDDLLSRTTFHSAQRQHESFKLSSISTSFISLGMEKHASSVLAKRVLVRDWPKSLDLCCTA